MIESVKAVKEKWRPGAAVMELFFQKHESNPRKRELIFQKPE